MNFKKLDQKQLFEDFYEEMSLRGATSELFMEAGTSANEAVIGTPDEGVNMEYWNIPPLVINEETKKKIIESRGGIEAILEFMAFNANWPQYQKFYNKNQELIQ